MLERLLSDEKHSKNVRIKHSAELGLGDFFDRHELVNARVVDEDVDLSEGFLRSRKQFFNIGLFRNARLDGDSVAATFTDLIHHFVRIRFRRRVIHDYGGPMRRQFFCDRSADSLRRARYHCNFSSQFPFVHFVPFLFWSD